MLLAGLLLLSASGVCAASMARPVEPSHPCCPQAPRTAPPVSCCQLSGIPALAPSLPIVVETGDAVAVTAAVRVPAVSHTPAEAMVAIGDRFHVPLLFLRLHQLLI